jgi:membrane carboxypeptidase/penicillin-binding protein
MADTTFAMQQVVLHGTGAAANALGRPAAGKTGTTNGNVSAWFDGFTPQLATAVGMYRNSKSGKVLSLNGLGGRGDVQGASFAVPIWTAYMEGALKGTAVKDFPPRANTGAPINPKPTQTATPTHTATATKTPTHTPTGTSTGTPTGSPTTNPGGGTGGGGAGGGGATAPGASLIGIGPEGAAPARRSRSSG